MRILCVGSGLSIHTLRWVRALAGRGHDVHLATQHALREPLDATPVHRLPVGGQLGYFVNAPALRRLVRRLAPDVLHVHYASGYATTARLARPSIPIVLTVWGSDVLEFPGRGRLHRAHLLANLRSATIITSASQHMADVVRLLHPAARVAIVPFGVDTEAFRPGGSPAGPVVGTVKGLDPVYGVDVLLRAFALLPPSVPGQPTRRLVVAGTGAPVEGLRALARTLGIADAVHFAGDVPHAEVPALLRTFQVYAALSRRESFGVAVAEASACECPVVVTRVGGLPEVVDDGATGLLVPPDDPAAAAQAIEALLNDRARATAMGRAGRALVQRRFEWADCVDAMLRILHEAAGEQVALRPRSVSINA